MHCPILSDNEVPPIADSRHIDVLNLVRSTTSSKCSRSAHGSLMISVSLQGNDVPLPSILAQIDSPAAVTPWRDCQIQRRGTPDGVYDIHRLPRDHTYIIIHVTYSKSEAVRKKPFLIAESSSFRTMLGCLGADIFGCSFYGCLGHLVWSALGAKLHTIGLQGTLGSLRHDQGEWIKEEPGSTGE